MSIRPFWIIAFILSSVAISVSLLPTIRQFAATPEGTVFLGTHNNLLDYPMFVSAINRGQRGKWTNKAVFTSEPQPPDFVHWIYIPLGKLTKLFSLNSILSYQLGRVIFALTLCLSSFYFITQLFPTPTDTGKKALQKPKSRVSLLRQFSFAASNLYSSIKSLAQNPHSGLILASFILSTFSAGFTRISFVNNQLRLLGPYLEWWTGGDTLRRTTFQPHAMLKNTLLFFILSPL